MTRDANNPWELTSEELDLWNEICGSGKRVRETRNDVAAALIILCRNGGHPTAENINTFAFGPNSSAATTYRHLSAFERDGFIVRRNFDSGRECYEVNKSDHGHIVNISTGIVTNVNLPSEVRDWFIRLANHSGLNIIKLDFTIYGEETRKAEIE